MAKARDISQLSAEEQERVLANLQPLWWQDNLAKGSKMPATFTNPANDVS